MEQETYYRRSKVDGFIYEFEVGGVIKPHGDVWEGATKEDFLREHNLDTTPAPTGDPIADLKQRLDALEAWKESAEKRLAKLEESVG